MAIGNIITAAVTHGAKLYSKIPPSAKQAAAYFAASVLTDRVANGAETPQAGPSPFSEAAQRSSAPKRSSGRRQAVTKAFNQAYQSPLGQALKDRAIDGVGYVATETFRAMTAPMVERVVGRTLQNPAARFAASFFEPELARATANLLEPRDGAENHLDRIRLQVMHDAVQTAAITASHFGIGTGFVPRTSDFSDDHRHLYSTGHSYMAGQDRQDFPATFAAARFQQKVEVVGAGVRSMLEQKAAAQTSGSPRELHHIRQTLGKLSNVELGILNLESYLRTATNGFLVDEMGAMPIPANDPVIAAYLSIYGDIIKRIVSDPDLNTLIGGIHRNG